MICRVDNGQSRPGGVEGSGVADKYTAVALTPPPQGVRTTHPPEFPTHNDIIVCVCACGAVTLSCVVSLSCVMLFRM